MSDTDRRMSKAVLAVLILAGLVTGSMAYRQMIREARAVAASRPQPLPVRGRVPDFAFTRQDETPLTCADMVGSVWIADFIFTRCAGPCPLMTQRMAEFQDRFAGRPDIRFVSFSVDPENDTPPVLASYAALFNADPRRWSFLTGSRRAIHDLSINGFKLAVGADPADENLILHSTQFVLVDRQRRIRGYYDETDPQAMQRLATDVQRLADQADGRG